MQPVNDEIIQIVDADNVETGTARRSTMRAQRLIHRASFILVFNHKDELFLQKRTMHKDLYPGAWDIAAGGVVLAGESYEESAHRELSEELGVGVEKMHHCFDYYFEDATNRVWGAVFYCRHEGPFTLQESEISEGRFLGIDEIFTLSERESFTPDGIDILRTFCERKIL